MSESRNESETGVAETLSEAVEYVCGFVERVDLPCYMDMVLLRDLLSGRGAYQHDPEVDPCPYRLAREILDPKLRRSLGRLARAHGIPVDIFTPQDGDRLSTRAHRLGDLLRRVASLSHSEIEWIEQRLAGRDPEFGSPVRDDLSALAGDLLSRQFRADLELVAIGHNFPAIGVPELPDDSDLERVDAEEEDVAELKDRVEQLGILVRAMLAERDPDGFIERKCLLDLEAVECLVHGIGLPFEAEEDE